MKDPSDFIVVSERQMNGYILRTQQYPYNEDTVVVFAYNLNNDFIGAERTAEWLINERGIQPESIPGQTVCSIGFCEREQKWYGWSHRAIYGYGIGDVVSEGDCTATSGWSEEYLIAHPEKDKRLPVGFVAKTLDDAKLMAIAFADCVG